MNKKLFAFSCGLFFLLFTQPLVLAADLNLPQSSINPDNHFPFMIKRLIEKGNSFTKISKESKAEYHKELILVRLAELKYVVENKVLGEVQQSTQRLSAQIGNLSDYLQKNKNELSAKITANVNQLNDSKVLLAELRDKYPANSSYWMLVQHTINSIDLNLEKLK